MSVDFPFSVTALLTDAHSSDVLVKQAEFETLRCAVDMFKVLDAVRDAYDKGHATVQISALYISVTAGYATHGGRVERLVTMDEWPVDMQPEWLRQQRALEDADIAADLDAIWSKALEPTRTAALRAVLAADAPVATPAEANA